MSPQAASPASRDVRPAIVAGRILIMRGDESKTDAVKVKMSPRRIQRKRARGWRMPQRAVYVGRPTKWGNPFRVGDSGEDGLPMSRAETIDRYSRYLQSGAELDPRELRGKDLVCWCALNSPCHADVLLRLANGRGVGGAERQTTGHKLKKARSTAASPRFGNRKSVTTNRS